MKATAKYKNYIHEEFRITKNAVLWDVAPCRYCVNRRFGGAYRHLLKLVPRSRIFSSTLKMEGKRSSEMFLRNVGLHNIYMA
jgi:hypothetical protein